MNNDDRCKNIRPRDDFCYKVIDNNTSFDFLIDYEPIKVFYNEAILNTIESIIPANLQKYKDLIQINAYHTAVAFQSNSYAFTIDLICPTGMSSTLSPIIQNNNLPVFCLFSVAFNFRIQCVSRAPRFFSTCSINRHFGTQPHVCM